MSVDAGVQWFHGLGFRPAVLTPPHRADQVDPARIVPAPDADIAYSGKFDPFGHLASTGYAWGTWLPQPDAPQITAASLAGPVAGPFTAGPLIPGPWPSGPEWPCCIETGPFEPLPPVAPVPVPASASLLIAAVAAFAIIRRRG